MPSSLSNVKFDVKQKNFEHGTKVPYLGTFIQNLKNYCHILYQHLRIWKNTYFYAKKKQKNFRTKMSLFGNY